LVEERFEPFRTTFELAAGEPLKLRIFLDRSMLEVFAVRPIPVIGAGAIGSAYIIL